MSGAYFSAMYYPGRAFRGVSFGYAEHVTSILPGHPGAWGFAHAGEAGDHHRTRHAGD